MSCQVLEHVDGTIKDVKAPNGESSHLYDFYLEFYDDPELALNTWAYVHSDEFNANDYVLDENGEPRIFFREGQPVFVRKDGVNTSDIQEIAAYAEFAEAPTIEHVNDTQIYKKKPKFLPLVENRNARIRLLVKRRNDMLASKREETNDERKVEISKRILRLNKEIERLRSEIETLSDTKMWAMFRRFMTDDERHVKNILQREDLSFNEIEEAERIIKLYQRLGTFAPNRVHPIMGSNEKIEKTPLMREYREELKVMKNIMEHYDTKLHAIKKAQLEKRLTETFGNNHNVSLDDFLKDIGIAESQVLDISEYGIGLLDAMHEWNKTANFQAKHEATKIFEDVNKLLSNLSVSQKEAFQMMQQTFSNTDKRLTGDLVTPFTKNFYSELFRLISQAKDAKRSGGIKNKVDKLKLSLWNKATDWMLENAHVINAELLLKAPIPKRREYRQYLTNMLGEELAEKYIIEAINKYNEYQIDLKTQQEIAAEDTQDEKLRESISRRFDLEHNPLHIIGAIENGVHEYVRNKQGIIPAFIDFSFDYAVVIPLRVNQDGDDLGHYDEKYEEMSKNKSVKALYDYTIKTIHHVNSYLPDSVARRLRENSLPTIEKSLVEQFSEKGRAMGILPIWEQWKKSLRDDAISEVDKTERDPETGEPVSEIQLRYIRSNSDDIRHHIRMEEIEWKKSNKTSDFDSLTDYENKLREMRREWRKDKLDMIANEKSFDIGRVLMAYSLWGLGYIQKTRIESTMKAAESIIHRAGEIDTNVAANPLRNIYGELVGKERGPVQLRKALGQFMNQFYGFRMHAAEGAIKNKKISDSLLTRDEEMSKEKIQKAKDVLKELLNEDEITQEEYDENYSELDRKEKEIGGVFVASKLGNKALRLTQLYGLGWNLFAAVTNVGFGLISGGVQSADGRIYSETSYWRAMRKMMNSSLRNYTFNGVTTTEARKIRNLMDYFDALKSSKYEILTKSRETTVYHKYKSKVKWASFYNPQQRSEFFVQGADLVAVLLDNSARDKDGNVVELYDAFDKDGQLMEGYEVYSRRKKEWISDRIEILNELKITIDKVIKENHGNYDPDSPELLKRSFWGRAFSMFRTWMFMGFQSRYGKERFDNQLGIERKGRYRTLGSWATGSVGNAGLFTVENLLKSTGYLLNKMFFGAIRASGAKITTFEDVGLSELDAANMRRNFQELSFFIQMGVVMLLAGMFKDGEDDDEKKGGGIAASSAIALTNVANRLVTDITFYTNPGEFQKISRNLFPMLTIWDRTVNWFDALIDVVLKDKPNFDSGPHKGQNKLTVRTIEALPAGSNLYSLKRRLFQEIQSPK